MFDNNWIIIGSPDKYDLILIIVGRLCSDVNETRNNYVITFTEANVVHCCAFSTWKLNTQSFVNIINTV